MGKFEACCCVTKFWEIKTNQTTNDLGKLLGDFYICSHGLPALLITSVSISRPEKLADLWTVSAWFLFSLWRMERNIGNKIPISLLLCSDAEVASTWTSQAEAQEVHLEKLSHFLHDRSTFILIWCSYRKLSINNEEVCSLLFPSQVSGKWQLAFLLSPEYKKNTG